MSRHVHTEAVILALRKTASQHRRVELFSSGSGLLTATAYGAKKGKLTGSIGQFYSGECVLYHNPVRNQYKIEDFSPTVYRTYIRESLELLYTASFFAEVLLSTYAAGGEYERLYALLTEALDNLRLKEFRRRIVIQFVWRYLQLSGFISSELDHCALCGKQFTSGDNILLDPDVPALVCCSHSAETAMPGNRLILYPAARAYLLYTGRKAFTEALNVKISAKAEAYIEHLLVQWVDLLSDSSLKTIRNGIV
jgi:DNA repair protein RecO